MHDGWVRVLRPFNSISVISRRWKGEHERLCAMKRRLGSGRISPPAGFEPVILWSEDSHAVLRKKWIGGHRCEKRVTFNSQLMQGNYMQSIDLNDLKDILWANCTCIDKLDWTGWIKFKKKKTANFLNIWTL